MIGAGMGSIIGSAIVGGAGMASAKQVNDTTKNLADTRYQRTVADMKKAGLNPMLAAGQGATSGSVPQMVNPVDSAVKGITETANSAVNYKLKKQLADKAVVETQNAIKQGQYLDAQTQKAIADTNYVNTSAQGVAADNQQKEARGGFWDDVGSLYEWGSNKVKELGHQVSSALEHRVPESQTGGKIMGRVGGSPENKPVEMNLTVRKNKNGDWTSLRQDGSWTNGQPASGR